MKHILVLGAGNSTSFLVSYLLKQSEENDWFITVTDLDASKANQMVAGHPRGQAIGCDMNDSVMRNALISKTNVVINMLTRPFQYMIGLECLNNNAHMLTASYEDPRIRNLDTDAHRKNILILNEMGLDPGIDHMMAMSMIEKIHSNGGVITSLKSYGTSLPSPDSQTNPLRYVITWNPRNILMAGEDGAVYKEGGKIKVLPFHQVFQRTWTVDIEGLGSFEAYPNRDSLSYESMLGLEKVKTIIRATLRYPGWSETWQQIVYLGMTNEALRIQNLKNLTYRELTEMFIPVGVGGGKLEHQVANYLGISPTGKIMENLKWLGLFSKQKIEIDASTIADVMIHLIKQKLQMPDKIKDMVILMQEMEIEYPDDKHRKEKLTSTMIDYGETGGVTAIAKTVGAPIAIAAKLLLNDKIPLTGCHIPTHPAIYKPVLKELEKEGISFSEKIESIV